MPVVADFTFLSHEPNNPQLNEGPFTVGDAGPLSIPFSTGGGHFSAGLLTLMVRFLTDSVGPTEARVRINGVTIGQLQATSIEDQFTWRHEQFAIPSNILNHGSGNQNTLTISRVLEDDNVGGNFDDFQVRDIVCFFHQVA